MSKLAEAPATAQQPGQAAAAPDAGSGEPAPMDAQPTEAGAAAVNAEEAPPVPLQLPPGVDAQAQAVHASAIQAAMQALQVAGLHQLIMQQTYTQLPPGMPGAPGQFGQQLGLSASWLGSLPGAPSSGAPQSSMGLGMGPTLPGLETLSNMQQAMSSQLAGALPAWAALLQPGAGLPAPPLVASTTLSLDLAPPTGLGSGGQATSSLAALPPTDVRMPQAPRLPANAPRDKTAAAAAAALAAPMPPAGAAAAAAPVTSNGHKRTASPRPLGGTRKKQKPSRSETL